MIVKPENYISQFRDVGADTLSIHFEASVHLHRSIQQIRLAGMKVGVAINPHTPVSMLEPVITEIDLICLMSVNPGFGGQKFIESTYSRVTELKEIIKRNQSGAKIEIDGGVDLNNAAKLIQTGADVLVAGNTVFSSSDPSKTIAQLKSF